MGKPVIAIVPSAGRGQRFSLEERKTFIELHGVPLIIHTLKRLHESRYISEIIPVLREEDIKKGYELVEGYGLNKVKRIVKGGKERQDSVYNGLMAISGNGLVLIHDGVRPIIPDGMIEQLIDEVNGFDGVAPGLPLKETIKAINDNSIVIETVNRDRFWSIQTPQVFHLDALKRAYENAYKTGYYATDDAALIERMGGVVKIIKGSPYNIKVTTPEDLEMVRLLTKRLEPLCA